MKFFKKNNLVKIRVVSWVLKLVESQRRRAFDSDGVMK